MHIACSGYAICCLRTTEPVHFHEILTCQALTTRKLCIQSLELCDEDEIADEEPLRPLSRASSCWLMPCTSPVTATALASALSQQHGESELFIPNQTSVIQVECLRGGLQVIHREGKTYVRLGGTGTMSDVRCTNSFRPPVVPFVLSTSENGGSFTSATVLHHAIASHSAKHRAVTPSDECRYFFGGSASILWTVEIILFGPSTPSCIPSATNRLVVASRWTCIRFPPS